MTNITSKPRTLAIISMVFMAAFARLIPHPWNFTPIAAMALFGGVYFKDKALAFVITILSLIVSDVLTVMFINNHFTTLSNYFVSYGVLSIYGCFILTIGIGFLLRKKTNLLTVVGASLVSSTLFYLVTNYPCWVGNPIYPKNIEGLTACYIAGLEFYRNGILGDLFYSGVLFGGFYLARLKFPILAKV
ncbi:MAG: DUF6580 family putative transport protein [Bacteroidota bacterium]